MFYITAHTVTQNQFANAASTDELANSSASRPVYIDIPPSLNHPHPVRVVGNANLARGSVILLPSELNPFQTDRKTATNKELHGILIATGLR